MQPPESRPQAARTLTFRKFKRICRLHLNRVPFGSTPIVTRPPAREVSGRPPGRGPPGGPAGRASASGPDLPLTPRTEVFSGSEAKTTTTPGRDDADRAS